MQLTINRPNGAGSEQLHANVMDNEDAAAAAVRICYETDNLDHGLVGDIHKHLQAHPTTKSARLTRRPVPVSLMPRVAHAQR